MNDLSVYLLSITQVKVLPISEKNAEYAGKVLENLRAVGVRAELDNRNEKIGYKIREAQLQKTPYMLIVGKSEEENEEVSVRMRDMTENETMGLAEFVEKIAKEIKERK